MLTVSLCGPICLKGAFSLTETYEPITVQLLLLAGSTLAGCYFPSRAFISAPFQNHLRLFHSSSPPSSILRPPTSNHEARNDVLSPRPRRDQHIIKRSIISLSSQNRTSSLRQVFFDCDGPFKVESDSHRSRGQLVGRINPPTEIHRL